MKYKINKLNKKVELQKLEKLSDGVGGFDVKWSKIKDLWVNIRLINNSTNDRYNMLEVKATHIITVRKLNNIDKNVRFVCGDDIFVVKYVNDVGCGFVEVVCEAVE